MKKILLGVCLITVIANSYALKNNNIKKSDVSHPDLTGNWSGI